MGERWVILLMREAFYGVTRFDGFQRALGVAPNILSARLRKLVEYGIFARVPTSAHRGRYDYRLTDKGRDFFPAYVALKSWGDRWMAGPKGPLVLFREKHTGIALPPPSLLSSTGRRIEPEDVDVVPGPAANSSIRRRFGQRET